MNLLVACLLAFLVALGLTRLMMAWAPADRADVPDEARKLHTIPTPTSGGVAIMAGGIAGCALLVLTSAAGLQSAGIATLTLCLGVALGAGLLGYWDDRANLSARFRLVILLCLTGGFVGFGLRIEDLPLLVDVTMHLGPWVGGLGTMLWLLVIVNVVNFTDGANGMAMGCSAIGLACLALLSGLDANGDIQVGPIALICALACGGFLVWNIAGRIFAGDAGALFIGMVIGVLGVWAGQNGVSPLAIAQCFLPMLADAILTILWRARRGANLMSAHADHVYQLAIRTGSSHQLVALVYWLASAICGAMAIFMQQGGAGAVSLGFVACLALIVLVLETRRSALRARLPK